MVLITNNEESIDDQLKKTCNRRAAMEPSVEKLLGACIINEHFPSFWMSTDRLAVLPLQLALEKYSKTSMTRAPMTRLRWL